jgi:acyl-CoA dehydrogenase
VDLPNVNIFKEQIRVLTEMLAEATPAGKQAENMDFLLTLGELFTLVAYGQLLLEKYDMKDVQEDLIEQIFDFMIRDFSKHALALKLKPDTTEDQMGYCMKMIAKPVFDHDRFTRIWKNHVYTLKDTYEMNP